MNNNNAGQDKALWEKIIKQKMVTVHGSKSTYRLNDKKNSSVEIHYGASLMKVPLSTQRPANRNAAGRGSGKCNLGRCQPRLSRSKPTSDGYELQAFHSLEKNR